jgi:hypothetical protein
MQEIYCISFINNLNESKCESKSSLVKDLNFLISSLNEEGSLIIFFYYICDELA